MRQQRERYRSLVTLMALLISDARRESNLQTGASVRCPRSAAVLSRSSPAYAMALRCSETQHPADVLRLRTAALRPSPEGYGRWQCQEAPPANELFRKCLTSWASGAQFRS